MCKNKNFIKKANQIHNFRYDYSKVDYQYARKKVVIICKEHGEFLQTPNKHLYGQGCPKCAGKQNLTTIQFIEKANIIHNFRYDYSKVDYINHHSKIKIICKKHGEFEQAPFYHIRGQGCPQCAGVKKSTTRQFIEKANIIHNFKYDYVKSVYINNKTKVIINCNDHGRFLQTPKKHLCGQGCPKCGGKQKLTTIGFIEKANIIHNFKYDYSKSNYLSARKKIIIICKEHGEFSQIPNAHLCGQGCPKCNKNISILSQQWLDKLGINIRECVFNINGKNYKVDGYDPETNTIYEFYGDMWHGNPLIYRRGDINPVNRKSYGELYDETIKRENILKLMGYKLITIWESDWKKNEL